MCSTKNITSPETREDKSSVREEDFEDVQCGSQVRISTTFLKYSSRREIHDETGQLSRLLVA